MKYVYENSWLSDTFTICVFVAGKINSLSGVVLDSDNKYLLEITQSINVVLAHQLLRM